MDLLVWLFKKSCVIFAIQVFLKKKTIFRYCSMFFHNRSGLTDRVIVRYEMLLKGEKMVDRFLAVVFLVCNITSD